jgi:hypothetical protein
MLPMKLLNEKGLLRPRPQILICAILILVFLAGAIDGFSSSANPLDRFTAWSWLLGALVFAAGVVFGIRNLRQEREGQQRGGRRLGTGAMIGLFIAGVALTCLTLAMSLRLSLGLTIVVFVVSSCVGIAAIVTTRRLASARRHEGK